MSVKLNDKTIFHVHTHRCGHADNVPDRAFIEKAIFEGASDIWFTDHAPFPENKFSNRMPYGMLQDYITVLSNMKEHYRGKINVHIGLEIEYIPEYANVYYYQMLKRHYANIECMILGQHFAELSDGRYSFEVPAEEKQDEYKLLGGALLQGIQTGLFPIAAHPDRIFRKCHDWTPDMERISKRLIMAASETHTALEQNIRSMKQKRQFRPEFWGLVQTFNDRVDDAHKIQIVPGVDAHHLKEVKLPEVPDRYKNKNLPGVGKWDIVHANA